MLCQVCGRKSSEDAEYCYHCHHKLLVLSGPFTVEDQEAFESNPEEQFSFDEHLLERISILEEVLKRTAGTLRQVLGALYKLEQKTLVNQTGLTSLRELLDAKEVVARGEWSELWESRMDYQLLALEKRERFISVRENILALYSGEQREAFESHLDSAEVALLSFHIEGAVESLERAHQLDPENHELAFFLGETSFNEGETERALKYFDKVLVVKPEHYESLVYGGVLCHEQGRIERAEELLKLAVGLYGDAFLPAFSLGAVYSGQGRLPQAVHFLERAAALDSVPQALYLLGSCYYEMGKVGPSIRHLQAALQVDPTYEEAQFLLGLAYLDRRWYRKAMAAFGDAYQLHPRHLSYAELAQFLGGGAGEGADEWLVRAKTLLDEGKVRQALAVYRSALGQRPEDPRLLVGYAMACLEVNRAQESASVIDRLLRLEPGEQLRATAYATLLEALRLQGKLREGQRIGSRLLEEGGTSLAQSVACYEMAFIHAEMEEDLDAALRFAHRSLELSPPELRRLSLDALGWVHYKRREFSQAVDYLSRSNDLESSPRTLTHLGMALLAKGERERARSVLVDARRLEVRQVSLGSKVLECLRENARLLPAGKAKK